MSSGFLKFVWHELKPHRRMVTICAVFAVLAAALDTLGPIVMGWGFDYAAARRSPWQYGGAVFVWFVMRAAADWARTFVANSGGSGVGSAVAYSFTERTAARIMDKPLEFHFGKKIHELMERVSTFRWSLGNFLDMGLFDLLPSTLASIAVISYLFYTDWRIGMIIAVALVAYAILSGKMVGKVVKVRDAWNDADSSFFGVVQDAIRNILLVKSTTNEATVAGRIADKRKKIMDAMANDIRLSTTMLNGQNLIAAVAMAGAIALGASGLASGQLTIGQVSTILALTFTVFGYVRFIQWHFRLYLRATADWKVIVPELESPSEDFESGRTLDIRGDIDFRDVRFRYREDRPALEDINFSVPAGTFVAIVGESGEGKTTLVDLIGRYWSPQAGAILIDGTDVREINLRSLRSQIAYVPQDLTLFHESLGDNIRFGRPVATDEEVLEAVRLAGLADFVANLPDGLKTVVGERGLKLSGGERQRVALARAFLRNPRILILDEPTAHLDSKTEAIIHKSVHQLMPGRTVFVIAHRLRTVSEADIILVLNHGRIVEMGSHNELSARPDSIYVSLLKAQGMA